MKISPEAQTALNWIEFMSLPKSEQPYKQGMHQLGDVETGFCCLGLECHIAGRDFHQSDSSHVEEEGVGLLTDSGSYKACLSKKSNGSIGNADQKGLVSLNDIEELSFQQIAAELKRDPHCYFETEVADVIELAYS
jgi:hypothetical protein